MSLKAQIKADRRGNQIIQNTLNAGTVVQTGTNASAVRWLERMLKLNGFNPGPMDNAFTAGTAAALKSFQQAWGLPETGVLDKTTFAKLKSTQTRIRGSQQNHKGKVDNFGVGQKHSVVKEMEGRLARLGYDVGKRDGVFDMQLREAVVAFRKDQKDLPDNRGWLSGDARNVVRKEDRALRNHGVYRTRVLQKHKERKRLDAFTAKAAAAVNDKGVTGFGEGAKGKAVANLQAHLRNAGFDPKSTSGNFDERTEAALKAFQRKAGLEPTGRVTPKTWSALSKTYLYAKNSFSPVQRLGERSRAVLRTEKLLKKLGYKKVKADGIFDIRTQSAVKAFEKKYKLKRDGVVSAAEYAKMKKVSAPNLKTVKGCAQFLLKSPNVSFWSGLSTGSDRKNLERLAKGQKALVPAKGWSVMPKLSMMRALVEMAKRGRIVINALTGGVHSPNSNHYRGIAVDLDISTGNAGMIESIARRFGGARNFERDHIHLDF